MYLLPLHIFPQGYLSAEGIGLSQRQLLQPCPLKSLLRSRAGRRNGLPTGMCWLLLMLVKRGSPDMGIKGSIP